MPGNPATLTQPTLMMATELFAPGGVQRVGRETIAALGAESAPLVVWSLRDRAIPDDYAVPANTAFRLAAGSRLTLGVWAMMRACRRCDDTQLLLMHVHLAPMALPMLVRGARVVLMLYGVEAWRPLSAMERFVVERAARVIAISAHTARRFRDANPWMGDRAIDVCWLGVPADTEPADRAGDGESAGGALIVSRMSGEDRYKGHEPLIRAWVGVRRRVPDATLVVVGDGDDRRRLESLAADLGLDGAVRFVGRVSDRDLARWYARCAFFVMPSPDEGFGLVFLEAMRAGKACIGSTGAAEEVIVDGVTGTIVPSRDEPALVEAVVRLFRDASAREAFGRNGRRRFETTFTSAHFADRVRRLLQTGHPSAGAAA
jgi:phosphatidyl-myo-inositol dimannoside synthase